jgi:hypothetical protein
MRQFKRAPGSEWLRWRYRQPGSLKFGKSCVKPTIHAAEEFHQSFAAGRAETRSKDQCQPW